MLLFREKVQSGKISV